MSLPSTPPQDQNRPVRPPLEPGDLLPAFALPDASGRIVSLKADAIAGKPTLLILCRDPARPENAELLKAFDDLSAEIAALGAQVFAITRQDQRELASAGETQGLSLPLLSDPDAATYAGFGHWPMTGAILLVVGANRHLRKLYSPAAVPQVAEALEDLRREAARRQPQSLAMHPPVLLVPDVLSPEDCRHLIHLYDTENDNWQEPAHGAKKQTTNYKVRTPDYGRVDRVDHFLAEQGIQEYISYRLQTRLFPEIRRAFQYSVTRAETYRVGRYSGRRGGEAHGHRDNTDERVAHRRFACSINLNREGFEGGELRFPEFGDQRYQPETGMAICFSCSLLHEALEVTQGTRYVLMAFLYGET